MKFLTAAVVVTLTAFPSYALDNGSYDIAVDGGKGTINVEGKYFEIGVGGTGCFGSGTGSIYRNGEGGWLARLEDDGNSCDITGHPDGSFSEGIGCTYFHGASCGFSGRIVD